MTEAQLRKIDVLIAKRVFGAPTCDTSTKAEAVPKGTPFVVLWYVPPDGREVAMEWRRSGPDSETWIMCKWEPTASIEVVWSVVERLGLSVLCITLPEMHGGERGWQVRRWVTVQDDCSTNHASVCVAICLCALKSIGVDVEKEIGL